MFRYVRHRNIRSSSNLVMVCWFLTELSFLNFKKKSKFSVSVHYLCNGSTHWIQIWYIDTSWNYIGQVQIWSWYDEFFLQSYPSWKSFFVSTLKLLFGCMYKVEIACVNTSLRNAQVKFEFCYGPLILTKLSLLKLQENVKFLTFIRLKLLV
jgi:CDP-diglyceride synthetase